MLDETTYEKILDITGTSSDRAIFLGNGFSIACSESFSYSNLFGEIKPALNRFQIPEEIICFFNDDKDFENSLSNLEITKSFLDLLNDLKVIEKSSSAEQKIDSLSRNLRKTLIYLVATKHENLFNSLKFDKLQGFLAPFSAVYSTNYDLILYWINTNFPDRLSDGFGKFGDYLVWGPNKSQQNIFFLHGALHFFQDASYLVKKKFELGKSIVDQIMTEIGNDRLSLFVCEGSAESKERQCKENAYLNYCFSKLREPEKRFLITIGAAFKESDKHLIEHLARSAFETVYLGYYEEDDKRRMKEAFEGYNSPKFSLFATKGVIPDEVVARKT